MDHPTERYLLVSAICAALLQAAPAYAASEKPAYEKCYGVARSGKNDCASRTEKHRCAGLATRDGDPDEWVYVRKGTCEKLVNGKTYQ